MNHRKELLLDVLSITAGAVVYNERFKGMETFCSFFTGIGIFIYKYGSQSRSAAGSIKTGKKRFTENWLKKGHEKDSDYV